ncbi:glycosyl transferase [Saccharopolyspora spinosa]|uniref:glycosyl transferase n=1 Tax=Saccharopolyspora spinosa TaxID=60894 RepID=UPI0002379BD1|nr:glycosyl transferase [Saccharopolyspora spinosa]
MRIILTSLPYYSHLVPVVVPVAHALRRAGHTVAVATAPYMASELSRHCVEHLPLPNVQTLEQLLAAPRSSPAPACPERKGKPPRTPRAPARIPVR